VKERAARRCLVGPTIIAIAIALSTLTLAGGQEPGERRVRLDTLNVQDTVYHLSDGGGNTLVFLDEDSAEPGVVLIDTKLPGWGESMLELIGQITDLPVKTIINTHAHPDHAGSNGDFPTATQIIAHENTRAHMVAYSGANAAGLPTTTFTDRFSLLEGFDRIELYYFGPAHTDGDIVVVFPEKRVAYLGGLFPDKAVPVIDRDLGGSALAFPETLAKVVAGIQGVQRVDTREAAQAPERVQRTFNRDAGTFITGHGPFPTTYAGRGRREQGSNVPWGNFMTWDDLTEYADFNREFLEIVTAAHDGGHSVDQAMADLTQNLPDRYADYGMDHARANVEMIYAELGDK
jgi:glyoxylase-like metal-dependent hydrolase (beta-lactamase superfamily II)